MVSYRCDPSVATDAITSSMEATTCEHAVTIAAARFCRSGLECPEPPSPPVTGAQPSPPPPSAPYCRPPNGVVQPLQRLTAPSSGTCSANDTILDPTRTGWVRAAKF